MSLHRKITVKGTVQGVGFRPFIYRMANKHGLTGDVCNTVDGVVVNVFGSESSIGEFVADIRVNHPPLALIRLLESEPVVRVTSTPPQSFVIIASNRGEKPDVDLTRDAAICAQCLAELGDPHNRRYRHPFITCTECGPRYTIIKKLPYDRPDTAMADFSMCTECAAEYRDPASRRFHTQTVCCNRCGPRLAITDMQGNLLDGNDPVVTAIAMLGRGEILAIKGIGGFHLACRGDSSEAVIRLRLLKSREEKPLAVMAGNIGTAQRLAVVSDTEEAILTGPECPVVVCEKREGAIGIAPQVAPGIPTLGIMLAYTPLHHLLFAGAPYDVLVMTSGNISDEPMACTDRQVHERLAGVADGILTHDRAIHVRADDSIVRVIAGAPVIIRRARGYAPAPLPLPRDAGGVLGIGGIYKTTVAAGRGSMCYLSQYIGPAGSVDTYRMLRGAAEHLAGVLEVSPSLIAGDSHQDAPGRRIAADLHVPFVPVQHHHAHAAACMAENGLSGKTACVVFDGTGAGDDGTVWGGEVLIADLDGYERVGHLGVMPMPGGESSIIHPGRMAMGVLYAYLGSETEDICGWMSRSEKSAVMDLLKSDTSCIRTSSMGRLFDAASALLGICTTRTYEGQPAMMLEGVADPDEQESYSVVLDHIDAMMVFNGGLLLHACVRDLRDGVAVPRIAARFHNSIAAVTIEMAVRAAKKTGSADVCLSGGCFQNGLLVRRVLRGLKESGMNPVFHRLVPPNDGGVALGLVAVASGVGRRSPGTAVKVF